MGDVIDSTLMHINDLPIPIPLPIHQRGLISNIVYYLLPTYRGRLFHWHREIVVVSFHGGSFPWSSLRFFASSLPSAG